jgi:hypothetical protein
VKLEVRKVGEVEGGKTSWHTRGHALMCRPYPPDLWWLLIQVIEASMVRSALAVCAAVSAFFVYGFICMDAYFTCRHYHHPAESTIAVLSGAVIFQLPVIKWLGRRVVS